MKVKSQIHTNCVIGRSENIILIAYTVSCHLLPENNYRSPNLPIVLVLAPLIFVGACLESGNIKRDRQFVKHTSPINYICLRSKIVSFNSGSGNLPSKVS